MRRYSIANCFSASMLMKRYTVAHCFSAFALPQLLFVDNFQQRRKAVMTCCLAWNVSLLTDSALRKKHISMVWEMFKRDDDIEVPSVGTELDYQWVVHQLAAQKHDLFPWVGTHIQLAALAQKRGRDVLVVNTEGCVEEIDLVTQPDPVDLSDMVNVLGRIHLETAAQAALMRRVKEAGGTFSDIDATQMAIAYSLQRAELHGFHRTLQVWRNKVTAPLVKSEIAHWLTKLDDIERDSKAVLALLTEEAEA